MEKTTKDVAEKILSAGNGITLFTDRSGFPLSQAQRNLQGKAHYVEDGTLKFFDAKVLSCSVMDDGLLLGIVESLKDGFGPEAGRIYRPVFFDVFGNVVYRPEPADSFRSSKQANAAFWKKTDELDAIAVTLAGVEEKQNQVAKELEALRKLQRELSE